MAEDLVQETMLSAYQARDKFRGGSSERTWLVSILKRKIIDHYRKQSRNPESPAASFEFPFYKGGGSKPMPPQPGTILKLEMKMIMA